MIELHSIEKFYVNLFYITKIMLMSWVLAHQNKASKICSSFSADYKTHGPENNNFKFKLILFNIAFKIILFTQTIKNKLTCYMGISKLKNLLNFKYF